MLVREAKLADVKIIEPDVYGDHRGFFMESYSQTKFMNSSKIITPCPLRQVL